MRRREGHLRSYPVQHQRPARDELLLYEMRSGDWWKWRAVRGVRRDAVHPGSNPLHPFKRLQLCARIAAGFADLPQGHH